MARLYINYKRQEQNYAFAVRQWLIDAQGWSADDIFVDVGHLTAGVEWERKLLAEAETADAMLFLASDASLDIRSFCYRELQHARGQILAVTIRGVSPNDDRLKKALPEMVWSRQITQLDQEPTRPFPFVSPIDNSNGSAQLNQKQVESIGATLRDLGVAPSYSKADEKRSTVKVDDKRSTTPFYADHPATQDVLNRNAVAETIAAMIQNVWEDDTNEKNMDRTFMVHLHGRWGSGKTSILNFLREALLSRDVSPRKLKPSWIIVDYNAWRNQGLGPT